MNVFDYCCRLDLILDHKKANLSILRAGTKRSRSWKSSKQSKFMWNSFVIYAWFVCCHNKCHGFIRHGHTRVRATEKSDSLYKLYKWVQNQRLVKGHAHRFVVKWKKQAHSILHCIRNSYWMYMKGEKSCMNEERLEVLESLGFEWRVKPGRDSKSKYTEENNGGTEQSGTNNNPAWAM